MNALRWLCVLPGGFLAGVLILFPLHWLIELREGNLFGIVTLGPESRANLELTLGPGVSIFMLIFVGAYIAPRFQKQTALALAGLSAVGIIVLQFISSEGPRSPWLYLIWPVAIILGVVATNTRVNDEPEHESSSATTDP